jgi:hypothetical protein
VEYGQLAKYYDLFYHNKKYNVIVSMFAVFNHLKDNKELYVGIKNLLNLLEDKGVLIIDLHNNRKNGSSKEDKINI